jgi:hypothetical protein
MKKDFPFCPDGYLDGYPSGPFFYPLELDFMYASGLRLKSQTGKFILSKPGGIIYTQGGHGALFSEWERAP